MNKDAFNQVWEGRLRDAAGALQKSSGAGAVLVALFDGPWMSGKDPSLMGLAGSAKADPFRLARDLRTMADMLERRAGDIEARRPFVDEQKAEKPRRN